MQSSGEWRRSYGTTCCALRSMRSDRRRNTVLKCGVGGLGIPPPPASPTVMRGVAEFVSVELSALGNRSGPRIIWRSWTHSIRRGQIRHVYMNFQAKPLGGGSRKIFQNFRFPIVRFHIRSQIHVTDTTTVWLRSSTSHDNFSRGRGSESHPSSHSPSPSPPPDCLKTQSQTGYG